jgi:A/G-specific adenine glycosylase
VDLNSAPARKDFIDRLLAWYRLHRRNLPWRETHDPYRIWISEIMLQQTQVATVIPYYQRFLERFPDVNSLANASEEDVLKLWEGLGYYRRARQLHAAARQIANHHQGVFPTQFEEVIKLPGIGRYTAGAILSFASDQRLPILEANTTRLFARLTDCHDNVTMATTQKRLWGFAESILPVQGAGGVNQALMELGSQVCTPEDPACGRCPVQAYCKANASGTQAVIPNKPTPRKSEKIVEGVVLVRNGETLLLRRCTEGERWAGLWDFPRVRFPKSRLRRPNLSQVASVIQESFGIEIYNCQYLGTLRHAVMHYLITLHAFDATMETTQWRPEEGCNLSWVAIDKLAELPMSSTGRLVTQWA